MGRNEERARHLTYTVEFAPSVKKSFKKPPKDEVNRIMDAINSLTKDPLPEGVKFLKGSLDGFHRIRVGNYRVIYEIQEKRLIIYVLKISIRGSSTLY